MSLTSAAVESQLNVNSAEFRPNNFVEDLKNLRKELSRLFEGNLKEMRDLARELSTKCEDEKKAVIMNPLFN